MQYARRVTSRTGRSSGSASFSSGGEPIRNVPAAMNTAPSGHDAWPGASPEPVDVLAADAALRAGGDATVPAVAGAALAGPASPVGPGFRHAASPTRAK